MSAAPNAPVAILPDWSLVTKAEDVGFPIVCFKSNGEFEITKAPHTGGLISINSVSEQIVYEIGDPGAYLLPDVNCNFTQVHLKQLHPDVVLVSGAKGNPPTNTYKVCATLMDGKFQQLLSLVAGMQKERPRQPEKQFSKDVRTN